MSPAVIVLPALLFILCLFIHAALWRIRMPGNRPAALIAVFVLLPFLSGAAYQVASSASLVPCAPFSSGELFAAAVMQLAFACAYILTYPAFEALSPSLVIVLLAGEKGEMTRGELSTHFSDEALFEPRVRDLLDSGLATKKDGVLAATAKGRLLASFFIFMRAFLGLPKGGG